MKLPNLKNTSISEIVYNSIYEKILSGKLKPNNRITEQGISQSMGISRAPVREALKRLAEDRLILLKPRNGCFVADLSEDEIIEIYEIRKRLECMALEYAFDHLDIKQLEKVRQQFLDCKKLPSATIVKKETRLDSQLHKLIAEKSGCPNLQEMLEKLRARVEVFRIREANFTERAKDALEEHLNILNAILLNDKARAIQELENHIEHTKQNVLTNLKNNQ